MKKSILLAGLLLAVPALSLALTANYHAAVHSTHCTAAPKKGLQDDVIVIMVPNLKYHPLLQTVSGLLCDKTGSDCSVDFTTRRFGRDGQVRLSF